MVTKAYQAKDYDELELKVCWNLTVILKLTDLDPWIHVRNTQRRNCTYFVDGKKAYLTNTMIVF